LKLFGNKIFWLLLVILVIAFIIIKNNKDQFQFIRKVFEKEDLLRPGELSDEDSIPEEFGSEKISFSKENPPAAKDSNMAKPDSTEKPIQKMDDEIQKFEPSENSKKKAAEYQYTTPEIICPLKSDPLLFVIVKLQVNYSGKNLKEEIKFREMDIKGIIQNIVFKSEREDLKADNLRFKIKKALSELLRGGTLNDIIFKDFKIEIRKK